MHALFGQMTELFFFFMFLSYASELPWKHGLFHCFNLETLFSKSNVIRSRNRNNSMQIVIFSKWLLLLNIYNEEKQNSLYLKSRARWEWNSSQPAPITKMLQGVLEGITLGLQIWATGEMEAPPQCRKWRAPALIHLVIYRWCLPWRRAIPANTDFSKLQRSICHN